jgi:site-specific DNA recombinase
MIEENNKVPRVAGYIRTSTDAQEISPKAQGDAIALCCTTKGWGQPLLYHDVDVSSKVAPGDRDGMYELLDDAEKHKFDLVLVVAFDRLARDTGDAAYLRKELQSRDIRIAEVGNPDMSLEGSTGKLVYNVKAGFAEYERDIIGERTQAAMKRLNSEGFHTGRPPLGFKLIPSDPNPKKAHALLKLDSLGERTVKYMKTYTKLKPKLLARLLEVDYTTARHLLRNVKKHQT